VDKIILKFVTDVLYLNGILCFEEYDDIMECCTPEDLDKVFEKMMKDQYNRYRRGEVDGDFDE
jgi:hypothetical protein